MPYGFRIIFLSRKLPRGQWNKMQHMGKINNLKRQRRQSKLSLLERRLCSFSCLTTSHCQGFKTNMETHVFMVHTLHEDQLPVSSLGVSLVLEGSAELLNGHISIEDSIVCSTVKIQKQSRLQHRQGRWRSGIPPNAFSLYVNKIIRKGVKDKNKMGREVGSR